MKPAKIIPIETLPQADGITIGQWYWIKDEDEPQNGESLYCLTNIGSNYFGFTAPNGHGIRIHEKDFLKYCRRCTNPEEVISQHVIESQLELNRLMQEVHRTMLILGFDQDVKESQTQALARLVPEDVKSYKNKLIKTKEEVLPELFEKIRKENKWMAMWLKARMVPLKAQADSMRESIGDIDSRISGLEIYAGLVEEIVHTKKGKKAAVSEKLHLLQRMHFMDEECLLDYQHGGMEFENIKEFDRWLAKKKNFERLLPFSRCMIAFRVRRYQKNRDFGDMHEWIRFVLSGLDDLDKLTFLYIRNGQNLYRLHTKIDFGEKLFPDTRQSVFGAEELMANSSHNEVIPKREWEARKVAYAKKVRRAKAEHKKEVEAWTKLSKKEKKDKRKPYYFGPYDGDHLDSWGPFTPETVYYDDISKNLKRDMDKYNRIALLIQGIFDRSEVLHPHLKVRLWEPQGFEEVIELIFDSDHALVSGPKPDFHAFQNKLNASLKKGSITVGQRHAWAVDQADKHEERTGNRYFSTYGNRGPELCAAVEKVSRDKKKVTYSWERERLTRTKYWEHKSDYITSRFTTESKNILCIDDYKLGDYLQFFEDPRTRAEYLKWAPLLLAAEDYHAKK